MKVSVDEKEPLLVMFVDNGLVCADKTEEDMVSEKYEVDGITYGDVWNQVCSETFGSWLFRAKKFNVANYTIFYWGSRFKLLYNLQKSHMRFTANMANLEIERIDKLLEAKHGKQLNLTLGKK